MVVLCCVILMSFFVLGRFSSLFFLLEFLLCGQEFALLRYDSSAI